jgi:hypothetical protein
MECLKQPEDYTVRHTASDAKLSPYWKKSKL